MALGGVGTDESAVHAGTVHVVHMSQAGTLSKPRTLSRSVRTAVLLFR